MHIKSFRKFFAIILSLMMILSMSIASFADMLDVSSHWAKNEIDYLTSKGVVGGYPDGQFKPDKTITRAEFFKIINNIFGYSDKAEISFNDVKSTDWYYKEIQKAVGAGYVDGYPDNTIKPNGEITRQEAAKVVAITFGLDEEDSYSWSVFNDNNNIASWARNYVGVICDKGFVSGYKDGTYRPENKLTRAEAVKMISNAAAALYNVSGSYSEEVNGNLIVNTTDVTLKDMTISGDLYLAEGIGNGDVILDGVTVKGKTFVRGGGENSIHIKNSSLSEIISEKTKEKVRIVLSGEIVIPSLVINDNTIIVIEKGVTIKNLQVNGKTDIELAKGAIIEKAVINSTGVEIVGKGDIKNLQANEDVKVNDEDVEKGKEAEVEEGKLVTEKEEKDNKHSWGSSGGGTKYNVNFTVTNEVYNPITNALINIEGLNSFNISDNTNNNGEVVFNLVSGDYDYIVTHNVYKTVESAFIIDDSDIDIEVIMEENKDEEILVSAINIATDVDVTGGVENDAVVEVTLTTATEGADIYYTTDGLTPTISSTKYTGPFNVEANDTGGKTITVKAIGIKSGYTNSAVAEKEIVFKAIDAEFAGGIGTVDDPYQVATAEQLDNVRKHLDAYFIQIADIDLTAYLAESGAGYNEGKGWEPIGNNTNPFTGNYDGNNKTISNLKITRPTQDYVGLFGKNGGVITTGGAITNVSLLDVNVIGYQYIGGLIGENYGGTVADSNVSGSVTGTYYDVGGLVGQQIGGSVTGCSSSGTVSISNDNGYSVGGLVGGSIQSSISNSYSTSSVNGGSNYAGGLIGYNCFSTIDKCFATGNVTGVNIVGGLVGDNNYLSEITNSYAIGSVSGTDDYIGGLVGRNYSQITNSYSIGLVNGETDYKGGLVGRHEGGTYINSYWDTETSGLDTSAGGEGKTTAEMKAQITFAAWDFDTIWAIETDPASYPYLQ